jgi:hypothetical protein
MRITKLLASTAYLTVNKHLISIYGLESAILLADLISKEEYFFNRNELKNEFFFNTNDDINNSTSLSYYQIQKSVKILKDDNIIETKVKGIPAKTYYKINHNNIIKVFQNKFSNIQNLEIKKLNTINKNKVNNKDITKVISYRFKKPNIDELKEYFKEKGDISQYEIFYDYYESKGWLVGKANMKCWKSAVRNWLRRSEQKTASSEFPDFYDKKVEWTIGNDSSKLNRYHKHLRGLGWTCVHSPTAGTIWKK